jgi:hypothetical protein
MTKITVNPTDKKSKRHIVERLLKAKLIFRHLQHQATISNFSVLLMTFSP